MARESFSAVKFSLHSVSSIKARNLAITLCNAPRRFHSLRASGSARSKHHFGSRSSALYQRKPVVAEVRGRQAVPADKKATRTLQRIICFLPLGRLALFYVPLFHGPLFISAKSKFRFDNFVDKFSPTKSCNRAPNVLPARIFPVKCSTG
jgi:hypothetical protein